MLALKKTNFLKIEFYIVVSFIIISLHSFCFADLYYWIDEKGVKHFSNTKPDCNRTTQLPEIYSDDKEPEKPQTIELEQTVGSQPQKSASSPRVNIEYEYYDVSGVNINDLRSETIKHSPIKQDGITFRGRAQWYIMPHYKIKQLNNLWYFDNVSATVDITFTMPRWTDYVKAHREEQKRWDVFYKALMDHENGHKDIAIDAAKKLCNILLGIESHTGEIELKNTGTLRADEIYRECEFLNKQFDDETQHGVKTGAILR